MASSIYKLCLSLIKMGKTEGLREKIEVYHTAGKLTDLEYEHLLNLLSS